MRIGHNQSTQEYHSSEQPLFSPFFPPLQPLFFPSLFSPMVCGSPVLHHPGEQEIVAVAIKQLPADIRERLEKLFEEPNCQLPLEMFIYLI